MTKVRVQMWALYAAAWLPFAAMYSVIITRSQPMSAGQSLAHGFWYVLPAALLGVGVWRITQVVAWPPRNRWAFFATHVLLATVFAALWVFAEVAIIARNTGFVQAFQISKSFALYQTLD